MQTRESIYYVGSMAIDTVTSTKWGHRVYRSLVVAIDFLTPAPLSRLPSLRSIADFAWLVTMFVAFGVSALWAASVGRWNSDIDPITRNYGEDLPNILNYLIICPGYVTFGLLYILSIGRAFAEPQRVFNLTEHVRPNHRGPGLVLTGAFVFGLSSFIVANYAIEALGYSHHYWFATIQSGVRVYSALGYYYVLVNFVLNVTVMLTAVYAFKMWSVAWSVEQAARAMQLSDAKTGETFDEKTVMSELRTFARAYTYFKWFLFFLYINAFTWAMNEPKGSRLLLTASAALFIGVLVLVSLPKYHLQYWVHKAFEATGRDEYLDIRTIRERVGCTIVDVVILGSGLLNLIVAFAPTMRRFLGWLGA